MEKFRVALSADFRKPDGSPAYPVFDLTPLTSDPRVELVYVQPESGVMPAAGLEGCDALILLVPRFGRSSVPKDGRLAMVARFGVGYDNVDLPTCNEAGIAAVITPDGVRRPVAVSIITFILALSGRMFVKDRLTRQGPSGWNQRSEHMGYGPGRPHAGPARHGQYRRRGLPPRQALRPALHRPRPLCRPEARGRARHRAGRHRGPVPPQRLPLRQRAPLGRHPPHRQRRAARPDEAHRLHHQHRPRARSSTRRRSTRS